jgi:hypothetical protein
MSERSTYSSLRKGLLAVNKKIRIDRIENSMVEGMPDVNVCIDGVESWIEIKSPKEPKRSTTPLFGSNHKLSIQQQGWLKRQYVAGGNAYVFIRTEKIAMLVKGFEAPNVNILTKAGLASISVWNSPVPVKAEYWKELVTILGT